MSGTAPYSHIWADSGTVSAESLTGANRTFARVTYRRTQGNPCRRMRGQAGSTQLPNLKLPHLKPPSGVHVGRSGGGSGDGVHSSGELSGKALVASVILAHYANQLVAAGWTGASPAVSDRVAAQFFEAKDESGRWWEGVLQVAGSDTTLALSLTMNPRATP